MSDVFIPDLYLPDWMTTKTIHLCQITWSPSFNTGGFTIEWMRVAPQPSVATFCNFCTLSWHPNTTFGPKKPPPKKPHRNLFKKESFLQKMWWNSTLSTFPWKKKSWRIALRKFWDLSWPSSTYSCWDTAILLKRFCLIKNQIAEFLFRTLLLFGYDPCNERASGNSCA